MPKSIYKLQKSQKGDLNNFKRNLLFQNVREELTLRSTRRKRAETDKTRPTDLTEAFSKEGKGHASA